MRAAIITASDSGYAGQREDLSGPAIREILERRGSRWVLSVTICQGRNRQIRRMCALAGLEVVRLVRVREGSLPLGDLPRGRWRPLTEAERLQLLGRSS